MGQAPVQFVNSNNSTAQKRRARLLPVRASTPRRGAPVPAVRARLTSQVHWHGSGSKGLAASFNGLQPERSIAPTIAHSNM